MDSSELDQRLIDRWRRAADDLGLRVTAPAELRDAQGRPFLVEALVADFGSPSGGIVISARTERRLRRTLRALPGLWLTIDPGRGPSAYHRRHVIAELEDWGWFGPTDAAPAWYVERR
jgi:hypothetical protein